MIKIAILAPTGQVGFELVRSLSVLGEVFAIGRQNVDFRDLLRLSQMIDGIRPNVIVNAAAYTAVDKAESEQEQAFAINEQLPLTLAQLANKHQALLVHYSTDYVYPGTGDAPWCESDKTGPLSIYGQSKLAGDQAITSHCQKYLIFRTSWVYAARGNNFMKTMLKLAQSREELKIVGDQFGSPTSARLIAQTSVLVIQKMLQKGGQMYELNGIYHLASSGYTTWHGFANEIFNLAYQADIKLMLKPESVISISTEEYPTPAKRPKNSRLNVDKIEQTFNLTMPNWQTQLRLTFAEWLDCHNGVQL